MKNIIELYHSKYKFDSFYQKATFKILQNKNVNQNFGMGFSSSENSEFNYKAKYPDTRVDLPIWFGDPNNALIKIMFLGREPSDSEDKNNIEKNEDLNYVFGTPFGIEFWDEKNKYFNSFKEIVLNKKVLSYFTDVVKIFDVKANKKESKSAAKNNFWENAEKDTKNLEFLISEVKMLSPDVIIGLGGDSYKFLKRHFGESIPVKKIIHPAARQNKKTGENAWNIAITDLRNITDEFLNIKSEK